MIGSLTSLDACNSGASFDRRKSLRWQAVHSRTRRACFIIFSLGHRGYTSSRLSVNQKLMSRTSLPFPGPIPLIPLSLLFLVSLPPTVCRHVSVCLYILPKTRQHCQSREKAEDKQFEIVNVSPSVATRKHRCSVIKRFRPLALLELPLK